VIVFIVSLTDKTGFFKFNFRAKWGIVVLRKATVIGSGGA
jgi:hypothetical protein